jgi:hypothetical protein
MWLRRQPDAGSGPALATKLEVVALAVVIAITGILTVLTPPAAPGSAASDPGAASIGRQIGGGFQWSLQRGWFSWSG